MTAKAPRAYFHLCLIGKDDTGRVWPGSHFKNGQAKTEL